MIAIKQAKIEVVVKQFETQLIKDAKNEEKKVFAELSQEFQTKLDEMQAAQKSSQDDLH